ncbi:MAG: EamA family transporter [Azospirillum sp.]|nr:EamA family transporter [Azospirillum sp.]
MDGTSKQLTADYDPIFIVWVRYTVNTALMAPLILLTLPGASLLSLLRVRRPGLQLARGAMMLASAIIFVFGVRQLPIAEAAAIGFASPLMLIALSIPLLGETVGIRRWAAVLVGFAGVLVVVRPGTGAFQPAALLPLISALTWALALIASRRIGNDDPPVATLLWSALSGLAAATLLVPFHWQLPSWQGLAVMIAAGGLYTLGQLLLIMAFTSAPAGLLAPFHYSQMVWAVLIGWICFGTLPDAWTWTGAALIIASGLYAWHRERLHQVAPQQAVSAGHSAAE